MIWWISFATSSTFLGSVLTKAEDHEAALSAVNDRGINPGGSVLLVSFPEEKLPFQIHPTWMDVLLSRQEAESIAGDTPPEFLALPRHKHAIN